MLEGREHATMLQMVWRRFRQHPGGMVASTVVAIIILAVGAASLSPYDPEYNSIGEKLLPPSSLHLLGTDVLGRDVLTRVLYGGRLSVLIGIGATLVSLAMGVPIGMIAGYYGGAIDSVLMRITDALLALPRLFVLILLSAVLKEVNIFSLSEGQPLIIILAIGLLSWTSLARIVRSQTLSLREMEFVTAARSSGAGHLHIIVRHLLPNASNSIIVAATLLVPHAILTESGLSFIGFGVHPRTPTWGNMLGNAQHYMAEYPWVPFPPALMIIITIISISYIGDALRDALDPHRYLGRQE